MCEVLEIIFIQQNTKANSTPDVKINDFVGLVMIIFSLRSTKNIRV